jgi:glycosyltransferase involved in cell wall biosynthesis
LSPTILCGDYLFDGKLANTIPKVDFKVLPSHLDKLGFSIMPSLLEFCRNDLSSYDIVHMHVFRTFQNAVLYHHCKKLTIPYIVDAHGAVPFHSKKVMLKKMFDVFWGKKILRDAAFIVAENQVGIQDYYDVEPNITENQIKIQAGAFDMNEFKMLPPEGLFKKQNNIPEDKKIIMFLGRVHEIKGNDVLIEGFAELLKKRQDVLLVIVGGDDGHMDFCKQLSISLNIADKVIFTGFIGGTDKLKALVDADIVVQMSRYEQGAWAPIEGVLSGTPIIVSEHTGAGEDVRKLKAGYTAEHGNNNDLANKIDYVLENYKEALELTRKAAYLIDQRYSMRACLGDITDLYEQALKKSTQL